MTHLFAIEINGEARFTAQNETKESRLWLEGPLNGHRSLSREDAKVSRESRWVRASPTPCTPLWSQKSCPPELRGTKTINRYRNQQLLNTSVRLPGPAIKCCDLMKSSKQPYKVGATFTSISQRTAPKLREVKQRAQGHTARREWSREWGSGSLTLGVKR